MAHDINIKESIEDKKSWFNVKRFKIGNLTFERPVKALDVKGLTTRDFLDVINTHEFQMFETSKMIKNFKIIDSLRNEEEDGKINSFFNKKGYLEDRTHLINFTFNFNPYNFIKKIDDISGFLDYYYQHSKPFLFIPNIKKNRVFSKPNRGETIIDVKDYLNFVDSTYRILDTKNNKPIFVPVSLRMSVKDIELLAEHYLKKECFYYWFDFEGKSINETSLARINHFIRNVKDAGYYDKIVTYFTNVKREIISNVKDIKSPASDVLASVAGANIIGVDREPQRRIEGPLPPPEHKARLFDKETYYYVKTTDKNFFKKPINVSQNAIRLDSEFLEQTKHFLKELEIEKLLEKKEMLFTYKEGNILRSLTSKEPTIQKTLKWY